VRGRRIEHSIRRALRHEIPPLLMRANQFLSDGQFAAAADDLEQVARTAEARGGPRAPIFHIQAGRARMMQGQAGQALECMERGFGLLAARGRFGRLSRLGRRVLAELNEQGFKNEASQLSSYLEGLSPGYETFAEAPAPIKHGPLPTHCPGCGAPVRPDEVEWLDEKTAECAYCGSPVRGA
jgi:hypothetical protein